MEGGVKQLLMNHEVQTNETVLPNTVKPHPELFLLVYAHSLHTLLIVCWW